jgi:hypothetical protein
MLDLEDLRGIYSWLLSLLSTENLRLEISFLNVPECIKNSFFSHM